MDDKIVASLDWSEIRQRHGLSPREAAIARLICQGHKLLDVAGQLGICEGTVKTYCRRLYSKMDVSDQRELALVAAVTGRRLR